jgi:hypothetical protein
MNNTKKKDEKQTLGLYRNQMNYNSMQLHSNIDIAGFGRESKSRSTAINT